jgi:hypothetical protein
MLTEENNSCIPMNDAVSSVITAPWNMADAMNLLDQTLLLPLPSLVHLLLALSPRHIAQVLLITFLAKTDCTK